MFYNHVWALCALHYSPFEGFDGPSALHHGPIPKFGFILPYTMVCTLCKFHMLRANKQNSHTSTHGLKSSLFYTDYGVWGSYSCGLAYRLQ